MKRIILMVGILMLLMTSGSWAAGTVVISSDTTKENVRIIEYLVTFGADGSSPDAVALDDIPLSTGGLAPTVGGAWLFKISSLYGTTGPTDNTDFYIYRSIGTNRIDIMGANGENKIDNVTDNANIYPATSTQPLFGTDILSISGNSVANATVTLAAETYR